MTKTTRRIVLAAAGVLLLLLLWWMWPADRHGEQAAGGGAAAEAGGGIDVGPLADRLRLDRAALRMGSRASIAGHVRDPQGQAIAGATVCAGSRSPSLSQQERAARSCVTSEGDGSYRIEELMPVPQFVHASAPGHVPGPYRDGTGPRARQSVTVRAGQETRGIDVVLEPGGVELKGVVRDLSGGELEGAQVAVAHAYGRSGADGTFTLWVAPGETLLEARAEGYAPGWMLGVAPGQSFEIALTPESVLVGQVLRIDDRTPVADADVHAMRSMERFGPAITDANGRFRLEGLEPGAYRLEAFHDEAYGAGAESAVLGLGETSQPIIILAHPAYMAEGTVTIAGGGSCERGWVRLVDKAVGTRGGSVESDGVVRIRGLLPGTYEPQVECESYVPPARSEPVVIADAAVRGLKWEVAPGQAIRGKVQTTAGDGVRGVYVTIEPQPDASAPRAQTTRAWSDPTDASGQFEAVGLLPGRYRASIYSSDYPPPEPPVELELMAGHDLEDIQIELPATGELRGTVKDSEGRPVKGVEVTLRGDRQGLPAARTLDDGSFHMAHVPAGEYRALAQVEWAPLQAPGTTDDDVQGTMVTIAVGTTREVALVVESQHGTITGQVVDGAGGPLSDAFVEATRESDSASAGAGDALRDSRWGGYYGGSETRKLTDHDGRFELSGLAEGHYTLLAQRRGGGEGSAEHVAIGADVVIKIADPGSLAGTVRIPGGGAPQQLSVSIHEPTTGYRASDEFFRTGGAFRFPEVPRGTYKVTVEAAEGSSTAEASVSDGERAQVQLELAPLVRVRGLLVDAVSGAPVPGMQVRIKPKGGVHTFTSFDRPDEGSVSDPQGRFEIEGVAAGAADVLILPKDMVDGDYSVSFVSVQVAPSGASAVELAPIKIARRRVPEHEAPGDLGLTLREPAPGTEPDQARLMVAFVRPNGPAMKAGIVVGDEIVSVDGQDVTGAHGYLFRELARVKAGTEVQLGLARGVIVALTADSSH